MLNRAKSSTRRSVAIFTLSALIAAGSLVTLPTAVQAADVQDTVLLNTLGYTTGQSLLLTHMAVGTLADAFVDKTYNAERAGTLIKTYINVTNGMKGQLSKLLAARTLGESDTKFIQRTIEVLDLVLKESEDLKAYIANSTKEGAEAYDSSRQAALKEIKTLLSIKD